jgi:hypothetical protein
LDLEALLMKTYLWRVARSILRMLLMPSTNFIFSFRFLLN